MRVDSLEELKVAFTRWRRAKRHVRETVPDDLLLRARRAAKEHGVKEVVRAIRVERSRLFGRPQEEGGTAASTPAGLKLRVFVESHAMVGLLSSLCGRGGEA